MILSVCSLATICFAQQEYYNSEWHFSFTVPYEWKAITKGELVGKYNELFLDDTLGQKPSLAVFQKRGSEDENTAYTIVLAETIGDPHAAIPEEIGRGKWYVSNTCREWAQARMKSLGRSLAAQTGDKEWEKLRAEGGIFYDKDKNILYETLVLSGKNKETFVLSIVKLLGSNRTTTLVCHCYNEDPEEFLGLVKEIVESFSYNKKEQYRWN